MEKSGLSPKNWDNTKKLINIYGIASGMSYLHSNNVIHRDLKLNNVLVDDNFHPKISDFGLSKITDFLSVSLNIQSQKGLKGTPLYMAPEVLTEEKYSKSGDVYAFAFIVYELITVEIPFKNLTNLQIMKKVVNQGYRPEITADIPDCYRELIESCWSQNPDERPSFDNIVETLKNNDDFITMEIDESEFYDYIDYIDECKSTFEFSKRRIRFDDFIKTHERKKEETMPTKFDEEKESKSTTKIEDDKDTQVETTDVINADETSDYLIYPISQFNSLDKTCQKLVEEAKNDAQKQFIIGKSLIEGKNHFPKNIELGLLYIEQSNKHEYIESIVYYISMLIKGDIIQQDLNKANEYLSKIDKTKDPSILYLKGQISSKNDKYKEAIKYYEEGAKLGNVDCMYKYGKNLFLGQGIKRNVNEALKYLNKSNDQGYIKSQYFLNEFHEMNRISGFSKLPAETQVFFIQNNIKSLKNSNSYSKYNHILFTSLIIEKMFFNKTFKFQSFIKCLNMYKDICFEIGYPSKSFQQIYDLIIKLQSKKCKNIKIALVFISFSYSKYEAFNFKNISYYGIDSRIKAIPNEAFKYCYDLQQITIPSSVTSIGDFAFNECTLLQQISIPSSVTSIGNNSFYKCSSLTQIIIPSSVTSIGKYAFTDCSSFTNISIPSSINEIAESTFEGCLNLISISIPSSLKTIGDNAFYMCKSLKEISLPSSVTSIGENVFFRCSSLVEIIIPSSISLISKGLFANCTSLKKVTIPSSVVFIGSYAFYNCSSLTQISIPNSVTSIGEKIFDGCTSLAEITIPSFLNEKIKFSEISVKNLEINLI